MSMPQTFLFISKNVKSLVPITSILSGLIFNVLAAEHTTVENLLMLHLKVKLPTSPTKVWAKKFASGKHSSLFVRELTTKKKKVLFHSHLNHISSFVCLSTGLYYKAFYNSN